MTDIMEYDLATAHLERLARVPTDQAQAVMNRLTDNSTDHVIYAREDSDNDQ